MRHEHQVLNGRLTTLRPFSAGLTQDELVRLYTWARDPELLRLSGGDVLDVDFDGFQRRFLAQLARRNGVSEQWFVVLDDRARMIGRAGLYGMEPGHRRAELGIVLGERSCWDRGYGRDAVRVLVEYGFRELALTVVTLEAFIGNVRAVRAFESVGFRIQRKAKRFSLSRGSDRTVEMAITPADRSPREC